LAQEVYRHVGGPVRQRDGKARVSGQDPEHLQAHDFIYFIGTREGASPYLKTRLRCCQHLCNQI